MKKPVRETPGLERLESRQLFSGIPSSPTHVVAVGGSDTAVDLTFDRVGSGETSLAVWRSVSGGAYSKLAVLAAGSNVYVDNSCYPGTSYSYELSAENASGSSALSVAASATTSASGASLSNKATVNATAASATAVNLSWTGAGIGGDNWFVERSTSGGAYVMLGMVGDAGGTLSYSDSPLSPSTTYSYRMRLVSGAGYGNYSNAVSVSTPARSAGLPIEPLSLLATVNSASGTTLNWIDTNGGAASYKIETSPFSWTTPAWTQVAQTAVGASSYTLSTAAQSFYYVRIRAANASGNSGYTAAVVIRTASAGTGSPKVYSIGPGQQYTSLAALNWSALGPGDTVRIYPNKDAGGNIIPYYEKPLISVRGTAAAPITIIGMPDPTTGQLPILDGTNATTNSQWAIHYQPLEDTSLLLIGSTSAEQNNSAGWSPGYFTLANLEIRNTYSGNYNGFDGVSHAYSKPYGIYIEKGDHITIQGCSIHDNGGGIFGAGQGDNRNLENVTLDSNAIYANGVVGDYLEHNTYLEGIDTVYQYNTYGPLRSGSPGAAIKDRGAGTIIRYNFVEGGGHLLDVVEAQNYSGTTLTLGSFYQTYVYGNVLYNTDNQPNGAAATPIYYGNDTLPSPYDRNGVLYFYNNTLVDQVNQGGNLYRLNLFDLAEASNAVDVRNNIIYNIPATSGGNTPEINLLSNWGVGYFGTNWITQGWNPARPDQTFSGYLAGAANVISNAQNNPGFVSLANQNFQLASGSQCLGLQGLLPGNVPAILYQYVGSLQPGQALSSVTNLGAFQQGAPATAPAAPSGLAATAIDPLSIQLNWTDNSNNETSFLIERSSDNISFSQIASVSANVTGYTDGSLTSGHTYYYRVRAANAVGNSSYTNTASAIGPQAPTAPAAPSTLTAAAVGFGQINLAWSDNSTNETSFLLERSLDGVSFTQIASLPANTTTYSDNTLNSSTTYSYRIRAANSAGNSAYSNNGSATTATLGSGPFSLWSTSTVPQTVDDSDGTPNEVGVKFESDVAGTISGIRFYKGPTNTGTHTGHLWSVSGQLLATVTFTGETSTGWQTAVFSQAFSIQANTYYVASYFAPNGHYAEDDNYFTSSGVNNGPLHSPQAGIAGNNGVYIQSSTSAFPTLTFQAANYYVDVVFSPASGGITAPSAPSDLTATTVDSARINLSWADNSNNEGSFLIERSADGVNFTQIASVTANQTAYSDTGLSGGTQYTYRVRATNSGGNSAYSSTASATTVATVVAPASPSLLSATSPDSSHTSLTWTDNSNNETGVLIERSIDGATFTQVGSVAANTTSYIDTGLAAATQYTYRVCATNSAGNSVYTNAVSVTTSASPVTPIAPSGLTATPISSSQVNLSWVDNSTDETAFIIERSADGVNFSQCATTGANSTSYSDNGLSAGTAYYYRVRASNSTTQSPPSASAAATTLQAPPPVPVVITDRQKVAADLAQLNADLRTRLATLAADRKAIAGATSASRLVISAARRLVAVNRNIPAKLTESLQSLQNDVSQSQSLLAQLRATWNADVLHWQQVISADKHVLSQDRKKLAQDLHAKH
jgi:hypothetical protein